MKNVNTIALALLAYGGLAQGSNVHRCQINTMPTEFTGFLMHPSLPQLPLLGDTINIDMEAKEITDLTFESGAAIALKNNNAKLVNLNAPVESGILASFRGKFKSPTGNYVGVLYFQGLDKDKASGSLEIARLKFYEGFNIARYGLECTKTN